MDLETLELVRLDIEALSRDLLAKGRPRVARELKDVCRLVRARVIASNRFGDVIVPLERIAQAAAVLERNPHNSLAHHALTYALHSLATVIVDYRAPRTHYITVCVEKFTKECRRTGHQSSPPMAGLLARFQRLDDLVQFFQCLRVFGAHRLLILAAGIGPLQCAEHGARYWDVAPAASP